MKGGTSIAQNSKELPKGKEAFRGESVIDKKHPLNIRSMPAFWGEFGGLVKEMTGHRGEKVSLKGCIDEILH